MTTFKVGIVGCGSIAVHRHLPEYHANKHAEIAGIFDPNKDRAQAMADQYGARAYTTVEELLESDVDIISVCAPNVHHASISIAALDAGKHVLCEKPMAASVEEAEAMIDAEKRSGKTLMIAHNQRFVPSHVKARELIKNGEIGAVYSVRTTFGHGGPEGWSADGKDSWFFDNRKPLLAHSVISAYTKLTSFASFSEKRLLKCLRLRATYRNLMATSKTTPCAFYNQKLAN